MVGGVLQPLTIFLLGLGGGFLIPLVYRIAKPLPAIVFFTALAGMTLVSVVQLWWLLHGGSTNEIYTAGTTPPFSINLRFGLWEGFFAVSVNLAAMLGVWQLWGRLRNSYAALLLYLILVMGINGMVMTRDLFNQFVFLEIMSIATYGLLGTAGSPAALSASFKYIMATVLASSCFLLGAVLLYHVTGTLNIDDMIEHRALISGPIGTTALLFVLSALILELKPFPANGWGLDVYETAPPGIAALISGGVSAGVFFALFKLLPLFASHYDLIAWAGGLTFLFSNLAGLPQTKVQRLLGYSSIAQMGLLMLSLALLKELDADAAMPLVVGGLFFNHLFAKAGLFWLAGAVGLPRTAAWPAIANRPLTLLVFAMLLVAISGLPPFPGFWAKWELVVRLAAGQRYGWVILILAGSLLEAAYMFRWFKQSTRASAEIAEAWPRIATLAPSLVCVMLLTAGGWIASRLAGVASLQLFLPLLAGLVVFCLDFLPGRIKCVLMLALVSFLGTAQVSLMPGLNQLFAALLLGGGLVVAMAGLYRTDPRPGYYPFMTVLLLAIVGLFWAPTSLEFFFNWELITLSTYFLIMQGRSAHPHALPFLMFSLISAFCILSGFGLAAAASGTISLNALVSSSMASMAFTLLGIGFLIKAGAIGLHVWLPGAYAEADDDMSAMLSAVVSKVAIVGLFLVTYLAIRANMGLELAHVMAWIGLLTTLGGAAMALKQDDVKLMLAYSSMSQIGYIMTAIAMMSHLGWVTAMYLIANHLMVKGILFLVAAAVIFRTGTRRFDEISGLMTAMPLTFLLAVVALLSMSGLPPLVGFGAKWLLLSAMIDRGWYGLAALGVAATLLGLLYMFRFAYAIFLSPPKGDRLYLREAPISLLAPQALLAVGILALSFFPKLVMGPISAAIDPQFSSRLVWQGMSLEEVYAHWNPLPAMTVALMLSAAIFLVAWLIYRGNLGRFSRTGVDAFYRFYKPALAAVTEPLARAVWNGTSATVIGAAQWVRQAYTGNGQTYSLQILCYIIVLYLFGTYARG